MGTTYKALQTVTVGAGGASSISFTNIPQTYTDLVIQVSARNNRSLYVDDFMISINGSTSNFTYKALTGDGSSVTSYNGSLAVVGVVSATNATANTFGNATIYIPNYTSSNFKTITTDSVSENNATSAQQWITTTLHSNTAPITSLTVAIGVGGNATLWNQYSTATLYGVYNVDVSSAPAAPTIGTATAGNASASVAFTGVSGASLYTATSTPGSITGTSTTSPITVSGLTNGTAYTFKVKASNPIGTGAESAASNSITPINSAFESIATINGTGSAAYVEFTGIPATYTHLQIRGIVQPNNPSGGGFTWPVFRLNGDASNAYSHHYIQGNGSGVTGSGGGGNQTYGLITLSTQGNATNVFSGFTMDILDYRNSSKFKTVRTLGGFDNNGTGQATLSSCLWRDLSAISSIRIYANDGLTLNVSANATFALYGIKVS